MNYVDPAFDGVNSPPTYSTAGVVPPDYQSAYKFAVAMAEAFREENEALRRGMYSDAIVLTRADIDKAPPTVADWLKAFGGYSGSPSPQTPASEPAKPIDPRSEALGRAFNAPVHGNAPGLPPFDE